jgi:hypothetical protein
MMLSRSPDAGVAARWAALGAGFRGIPPIFVSITVKTSLSGGVLPVAVPSITGDRGF